MINDDLNGFIAEAILVLIFLSAFPNFLTLISATHDTKLPGEPCGVAPRRLHQNGGMGDAGQEEVCALLYGQFFHCPLFPLPINSDSYKTSSPKRQRPLQRNLRCRQKNITE